MDQRQVEFATYCIGNLSQRLGMGQPEVYRLLSCSGLLEGCIVASYDVLHTFGKDDLIGLMRERGLVA